MKSASNRAEVPRDKTLAWAALVAACAAVVASHAPVLLYGRYANVDESYAAALGQRILDGHVLYEGAISQRGPLMYYTYAAIGRVFAWDDVRALRGVALAFALSHVALTWLAARRLFGLRAAAVASLVTGYAFSVGIGAFDRYALNGEFLQLPWLLGGVIAGAVAMSRGRDVRSRARWLLLSGVCLGATAAVKQSAALQVVAALAWIVARGVRQRSVRGALTDGVALAVGCAAVPLAFVAHAWRSGSLSAMRYYTLEYNVLVHLSPGQSWKASLSPLSREVEANPGFSALVVLFAWLMGRESVRRTRAALGARRVAPLLRAFGAREFVAIHAAVAFVSACVMRRFFAHYFIPAIPLLALAAGAAVQRATISRTLAVGFSRTLVATIAGLALIAAGATYAVAKADGDVAHDRSVFRMARYIEATTDRDAKIFVWGFSPWLYAYSHRRPAGRFVFGTYVTGVVPWFHATLEEERARIVPGSVDALLGDLRAERPELVIDAGSIMLARSMRSYAPFAELLARDYCFEVRVRGYDVYRRRGEARCVVDAAPPPQHATDFWGRKIDVPIPAAFDRARDRPLPLEVDAMPAWYAERGAPPRVTLLADPTDIKPGMRMEGYLPPER